MDTRRDVYQAIADPTRRDILSLLTKESLNLGTLAEQFDMSRQAVSLHVKILKECGMISIIREGRERYCELEPAKLAEVDDWLKPFRQLWEQRLNRLDQVLEQLKNKKNE